MCPSAPAIPMRSGAVVAVMSLTPILALNCRPAGRIQQPFDLAKLERVADAALRLPFCGRRL
jgi:hypothetical protein